MEEVNGKEGNSSHPGPEVGTRFIQEDGGSSRDSITNSNYQIKRELVESSVNDQVSMNETETAGDISTNLNRENSNPSTNDKVPLPLQDMGDFDLSFFINNIVENDPLSTVAVSSGRTSSVAKVEGPSQIPSVSLKPRPKSHENAHSPTLDQVNLFNPSAQSFSLPTPTDFSSLDPISFAQKEPKRSKQNVAQQNQQSASTSISENPNRHLVPEELQGLIISSNPDREIKFTFSQRMNTQMVVDDYILKKKKGPYITRGGRVINWKCVSDTCQYTAVTWEGQIQDTSRQHNHAAQPELYIKKQARVKIRENIVNDLSSAFCEDRPVANVVNDVVSGANAEVKNMIGSIDALKQAARRFNRKLLGKETKPVVPKTTVSNSHGIVGIPNISDYEVVGEFGADVQNMPMMTFTGVGELVTLEENLGNGRRLPVINGSNEETNNDISQDNIEELLETSPSKQDHVGDELISEC